MEKMQLATCNLQLGKSKVFVAVVAGLLALGIAGAWAAGGGDVREKKQGLHPSIVVPKEGQCVRPTEWMRRNHMDLLQHHKVDAVRKGVRVKKESFDNCRTCHTKRGEFCDRCHAYAAVKMDCFDCHNYPK